jgi:NAD-dependent dihydropyrimidine dehydrogenase PreA subunit
VLTYVKKQQYILTASTIKITKAPLPYGGGKNGGTEMAGIVDIDSDLCMGCGSCIKICPRKILFLDEKDGICKVTDEAACDKYRGCERVCPTGAIRIH